MNHVVATYPNKRSRQAALLGAAAAGLLLVLVLLQLFSFEELPAVLQYFWGRGSVEGMLVLASVIAVCEVLALPALLGMRLSPLMRLVSAALGVLTAVYWLVASMHAVTGVRTMASGILGDKFASLDIALAPIAVLLAALVGLYWVSVLREQGVLPKSRWI